MNLCSAVFASGAAVVLYRTILFLLPRGEGRPRPLLDVFGAAGGAWLFSFCYGLWSQAINAETFAYTTFFILLGFYSLLRLDDALESQGPALRMGPSAFRWFGVATGCAVAAGGGHPISSVLLVPCAILAVKRWTVLTTDLRRVGAVAGIAAAAFALLYLSEIPLARANPPLSFGDPKDFHSLWIHVTAYYGGTAGLLGPIDPPREAFTILSYFLEHCIASLTPFALPFVGFGGYALYGAGRFRFLLVVSLPAAVWGANVYQITSNLEHTFLPAEAMLCLLAGVGLREGGASLLSKAGPRGANAIPALLLALPLVALVRWYPTLDRSKQDYPEAFGRNLLEGLPQGAILVSRGDLVAAACDYLQIACGYRRDVAVLTTTVFLTQGWHREQIHRRYPALDLSGLEAALQQNPLDAGGALAALIRQNEAAHSIFFMPTVSRDMALPAGRSFHPHGLTQQVVASPQRLDPSLWSFRFRDPELWKHPPQYLELGYKMGWIGLMSQLAQGYENLRAGAVASGNNEMAGRAAAAEQALFGSYQDELVSLTRRFPPQIPAGAPFGVQTRP